jgi:hypothetical protein
MGDEGWTTVRVGDKRARTAKLIPPPKRAKGEEEEEEDGMMLNLDLPEPSFELRTSSKKKTKKQPRHLHPDGISVQDLQSLLFWVYDKGANLPWIMLKVRFSSS